MCRNDATAQVNQAAAYETGFVVVAHLQKLTLFFFLLYENLFLHIFCSYHERQLAVI
jgi:hypothetical protein